MTAQSEPRLVKPPGAADSKSAKTRARILDAASHVLSTKGYAGMRLSDVAEHAKLQAPAIYYYFNSREDLIEEVMWVGLAEMRKHVTAALENVDPATPTRERILVMAEAHLRHELELSDYTTAAIRNAGQVPAPIRKRQLAEEARYGELWRDLIMRAEDEGLLRPGLDTHIAQMLVLGALNWSAEWWDPQRGSLDTLVDNARTLVAHGLFRDPEAEAETSTS